MKELKKVVKDIKSLKIQGARRIALTGLRVFTKSSLKIKVKTKKDFLKEDFVIQAGGGIHGHPSGTLAGARAMRLAIEASLKGIKIEEYAKKHEELKECLKIWKK